MWVKSIALCRRKSNTTGHVRIKKGEIVEFHVVITSRDNAAVLSSLINIVIVPLLPLLSSFSCCIIECENSILFCLQGQNWETSGSWRMNNILGQGMLFYIFPFFFWSHHWANVTKDPEGLPLKHEDILHCFSYPENCRDLLSSPDC